MICTRAGHTSEAVIVDLLTSPVTHLTIDDVAAAEASGQFRGFRSTDWSPRPADRFLDHAVVRRRQRERAVTSTTADIHNANLLTLGLNEHGARHRPSG
jgi:hypothetical protein